MKRLSLLLPALLIALCLLIFSCEKEKTEPLKPFCDQVDIVSSYTYPDNQLYPVARLTYDGLGRISLVQSDNHLRYAYTYFEDRIEVKATESNGIDASLTYFLDGHGRITHTSFYNYDFKYDNNGYLTTFRKPIITEDKITGFVQVNLEYQNGNLASIRYGSDDPEVSFSYYDQPNQELGGYNSALYLSGILDGNTGFYLIEAGRFGKSPARLLKKLSGKGFPEGEITYKFDSKGRIIAKPGAHGFTYQCD